MKRFFITLGMKVAATFALTDCSKDYVEALEPVAGSCYIAFDSDEIT